MIRRDQEKEDMRKFKVELEFELETEHTTDAFGIVEDMLKSDPRVTPQRQLITTGMEVKGNVDKRILQYPTKRNKKVDVPTEQWQKDIAVSYTHLPSPRDS